jgi:hypothetical protein
LNDAELRLHDENTERFYAAEIYRLLGEVYLRSRQDPDQAERYFCKGLEIARNQKAKSLELKVCTSMYDLHEMQQKSDKYLSQLTETYGFFTEGFDTVDLIKAKEQLKNV